MGFDKREKDAMAVAYLASQGILQEEIKTALNLSSQTEVSRLLSLAKKEGWLRWELNLPPEVDESEVLLRAFTRQEELKQRLGDLARINSGRPVTDIRVVYSSEKDTMEQRFTQFGRHAAEYVAQLLRHEHTKTCAIAWGRTVASLI